MHIEYVFLIIEDQPLDTSQLLEIILSHEKARSKKLITRFNTKS